ncbi:putative ankyrin repeat protein L25, partial [Zancudomyces culisetae]
MGIKNKGNNLFNKLPASILSTIFALAQNPQLSLLNKNMHHISQKDNVVSKYILQYVLYNIESDYIWWLRYLFDKHTRIGANEAVGILVLRKLKDLNYEKVLDMAFDFRWRNVLNRLLKMYVVINRSTSTILHRGTLFMNEDEYLDIDIDNLLSEESKSRREVADIEITDSHYIRSLFRVNQVSELLLWGMNAIAEENGVEMLIDICNTKFEFPPEICGSTERGIRCVDDRFMISCVLVAGRQSCRLNNLGFFKRVLDLEICTNFSVQNLDSINDARGSHFDYEFYTFIRDDDNTDKMVLLNFTLCAYQSILCDKKKFISYLEKNYSSSSRHIQILFDVAIHLNRESLFKKYLFKSGSNSENIKKITELAYRNGNIDLIKYLLRINYKLKGDLDENAMKIAIYKNDYKLAQRIINKYSNLASVHCLEYAVQTGNIKVAKLLIESGADLKSPEFKGIRIASKNRNMDMLRFLLEHDSSIGLEAPQGIQEL